MITLGSTQPLQLHTRTTGSTHTFFAVTSLDNLDFNLDGFIEVEVLQTWNIPGDSIGFSIINHPFWWFSPYFWKHPIVFNSWPFYPRKIEITNKNLWKGHVNSPSQRDHFESPWSLILLSNISNCSKYPTNGQMLDRNLARLHTGCWKTAPMLPSNVANNLKISWNQRCVLHNTTNWPPNTGSAQDTTNVEKRLTVPRRRSSNILMDWRR